MKRVVTHFVNKLWYIIAAVIILAALLVSVARLLTPLLNEHRTDFEKIASNVLQMPVMIRDVEVSWHGYAPEISLHNVTVLDPSTQKPKLVMQALDVDFNIWRSLWTRTPFIENITVSGVTLEIHHSADGILTIGDLTQLNIKDTLTGASVEADKVVGWVFSQPRLALENIQLHYQSPKTQHYLTLKKLSLQNTPTHHILDGRATLNQELPTSMDMHLAWDGDVRKLPEAKAHLYFYFEGLSLPQWFSKQNWHGLQITQGLASTKTWIDWDHNQINKIQTEFEVYGLSLYSTVERRAEIVNRVSASLGWKRDGVLQTLAGNKILLDFPDHLWPSTSFALHAEGQANGDLILRDVQVSYANLDDLKRLILETDFVALTERQSLQNLNPRGEIADLKLALPAELKDVRQSTLSLRWINLSVNPLASYPGVTNFTGSLNWNGHNGAISLDSRFISLTYKKGFSEPLSFDHLAASARLALAPSGSWSLDVPIWHMDNADLIADTRLGVTLPPGATPLVDLKATVQVRNATHLPHYLPRALLEPDFVTWLNAAFQGGRMNVQAVLRGDMKDFPFDTPNASGKFLVTGKMDDLGLNYAPGWPMIQHLNGKVVFAGSSMTADIVTGQIQSIPLANVHGVIPFIGANGPQILHVDGTMQSNLAAGMSFIQSSPLQKTIGKHLAAIKLTGPMQLKLGLIVPLGKPVNTTVTGDVTFTQSQLSLPEWRAVLDKLNGGFQFTEQGLTANSIQGEFFGAPATLQITTLHEANKPGVVRADLASTIGLVTLQKWFGVNVSEFATGSSPFQLQLYLSPQTEAKAASDRAVIQSTLAGIALHLPAPYGKAAELATEFQVTLDLNDSKFLKAGVSYAKLLNAALLFQKSKSSGLSLYGGEVHLGSQMPGWQTVQGLLVTGELPKLKVSDWQDYVATLQKSHTGQALDLKMLRGINLQIGLLEVWHNQLHDVKLNVMPESAVWRINIDSRELNGDLSLPFKWNAQMIMGHFRYVHISAAAASDPHTVLDPHMVPALSLDIEDATYKDMKFGHVLVEMVPSQTGVAIRHLSIRDQVLQLESSGEWVATGKRVSTHLHGEMNAPKIGDVLTQWGFNSANLVGTTGNVKFDLNWPDAPYMPSVATLAGTLSLKLGEGRITHLSDSTNSKMGLGRMLNVLSLSTIPKRLSLNFSDLFEQGYSFDKLTGDVNFKNGSAYIDQMTFDGTVANVNLKGRIGIAAKDFDIRMGVTPHVTGSLPIVAALAGGPVVGVATWLVDRVVTASQSSQTSGGTYEYAVTGSWDNPVWKQINSNGTTTTPNP